jgi:hypothetical protein
MSKYALLERGLETGLFLKEFGAEAEDPLKLPAEQIHSTIAESVGYLRDG